jgi:hypothetical protein
MVLHLAAPALAPHAGPGRRRARRIARLPDRPAGPHAAVYDPGGPTAVIDDFCVARPEQWMTVGAELLACARAFGRKAGWSQIVVVCGARDEAKAALLRATDLAVVTHWWRGPA